MTLTNTATILKQIGAIGDGPGHRLEGEDARFARGSSRRYQRSQIRKGDQARVEKYNKAMIALGGSATEAQIAKHLGVSGPIRFLQRHPDKFNVGTRVIRGVERTVYSPRIDE